jgi:hypothetical protein
LAIESPGPIQIDRQRDGGQFITGGDSRLKPCTCCCIYALASVARYSPFSSSY